MALLLDGLSTVTGSDRPDIMQVRVSEAGANVHLLVVKSCLSQGTGGPGHVTLPQILFKSSAWSIRFCAEVRESVSEPCLG